MENIININGIDYIRKSEYDKAKKDADTIRQMVSSSIADLSGYLSNQSVAQSTSKLVSKRSKKLQIRKGGQRLYNIVRMEEDGSLYGTMNRKLMFTIKDVVKIDKKYDETTTNKDAIDMSKELNIPSDIVHRIIYNIDKSIFKNYIDEFLSEINIEIERKPAPIENNPEKRRESVLFST